MSIPVHDKNVSKINRPSIFHYALVTHLDLSSHYSLHRIILNVEGVFSLRAESGELILKTNHSPLVVLSADLEDYRHHTVVIQVNSIKLKYRLYATRKNAFNYDNKFYWSELNFLAGGTGMGKGRQNEPQLIIQNIHKFYL